MVPRVLRNLCLMRFLGKCATKIITNSCRSSPKRCKKKEQKDKLNAVKARLIYGEESGIKIRSRKESHYSESKTPTARTEPRRRHGGSLPRTRMPSLVKTYNGSGDPEDHLKLFQSAAKTEGWAMPTWCHMFNSTLIGNARHIKDPVEIHHIKQRDEESTEDFMERYKAEVLDVEGAPECMRISGFMHGITHPGLIKRLYERIPRSMDEMYRMTTSFLQGEVAALSHGQRKASSSWKSSEGGNKPNFKKGFKNKQRPDRKPDRFSLLTKTPKEIFALEKGKFKAPPPMVTPVEKRDPNKYCEFHSDTGHNTNECMQLRKQIDEMIKAGKLSQFIKELKQNDKTKAPKKGEASGKDKPLTILDDPTMGKSGQAQDYPKLLLRRWQCLFHL
ncbi:hypothetical protein Tco_1212953 [Tanacetum coccineum]